MSRGEHWAENILLNAHIAHLVFSKYKIGKIHSDKDAQICSLCSTEMEFFFYT